MKYEELDPAKESDKLISAERSMVSWNKILKRYKKEVYDDYKEKYYGNYAFLLLVVMVLLIATSCFVIFYPDEILSVSSFFAANTAVLLMAVFFWRFLKKNEMLVSERNSGYREAEQRVARRKNEFVKVQEERRVEEKSRKKVLELMTEGKNETMRWAFLEERFSQMKLPFDAYVRIIEQEGILILNIFLPKLDIIPIHFYRLNEQRRLEVFEKKNTEILSFYYCVCGWVIMAVLVKFFGVFVNIQEVGCNVFVRADKASRESSDLQEECLKLFLRGLFYRTEVIKLSELGDSGKIFEVLKNMPSIELGVRKDNRLIGLGQDIPLTLLDKVERRSLRERTWKLGERFSWEEWRNVFETEFEV